MPMLITAKHTLKSLAASLCRLPESVGLRQPRVIINVDGGICSQMHFYLVGKILQSNGCRVEFNLDWYRSYGKDTDGVFVRNFDLLRAFPYLELKEYKPSPLGHIILTRVLNRFIDYYDDPTALDWLTINKSYYLEGYFRDPDSMYTDLYPRVFDISRYVPDADNIPWIERIEKANITGGSVAIHVRRGDLAHYNPVYGHPADLQYFISAVDTILSDIPEAEFFLFSDEPDWCRANIIPHLPTSNTHVVDVNGSDRGYADLMLMAHCRHIIGSNGSLGKYAALLRDKNAPLGTLILPNTPENSIWQTRIPQTLLLPPTPHPPVPDRSPHEVKTTVSQ